ncbi:MAG: ethylbenzene dehydrogenase-related protein [Candidatus Undinarchaeales archaeon]|jgi:hypothetical protein|nr:ethylbenzene dehydrogenase-related protein [Candidatus Undinarchaeales archaeon]MDP7491912.1 ethylbenzene dehydrogenase-related protein [Candidatus Undinarchaeales archaeon]
MRPKTVVIVSITLVLSFLVLVTYGFIRSVEGPVGVGEPEVTEAPFVDRDIDLSTGISLEVWDTQPPTEVELVYQLTVIPWPAKGSLPPIAVKAFHNGKDIYLYVSWDDETEDILSGTNTFSDACAIMFPLKNRTKPSSIIMGFKDMVGIWHWKADLDGQFWSNEVPEGSTPYADYHYPFEEEEVLVVTRPALNSAVRDLVATGIGTSVVKENQTVQGRGLYDNGRWHVVFKRRLDSAHSEPDATFVSGEISYFAFAVWNGAKGDRGGRKYISDWVKLEVK